MEAPVESGMKPRMDAAVEAAPRSVNWTPRLMEATPNADSPRDLGLRRTGQKHQSCHRHSTKNELLHLYSLSERIEELSQGASGCLELIPPIEDC